jgi:hypothetical protein
MIPSRRGSARDLASQQHGGGGALQHLGRGFRRRAARSHGCAMNRGRRVSTTNDGQPEHSRSFPTAIWFRIRAAMRLRLGSLAILDEPLA